MGKKQETEFRADVCLGVTMAPAGSWMGGPRFSQVDTIAALLCASRKLDIVTSGDIMPLPSWIQMYTDASPAWHALPHLQPLVPLVDRTLPRRFNRWARDALMMTDFVRRIDKLKPDVLWVEGITAHRHLEDLRNWRPQFRVMTYRGSPDQASGRFGGVDQLARVRKEMSMYDGLAFVSSRVADTWSTFSELSDKQIYYLPNCAREEELKSIMVKDRAVLRRQLGLPSDRLIGICLGSVQWRKGQQVLAEAMPDIILQEPEICVVFVGEVWSGGGGGPIRESFEPFLKNDYVRFLGQSTRALEYLYASDFLLLPSLEEAMPLAVLEAMVLGVPVVASTVGGIPELVKHGATGLLFAPGDPDALGSAVLRMSADADRRMKWALAGQERYWAKFSRKRHMERYHAALAEMIARS